MAANRARGTVYLRLFQATKLYVIFSSVVLYHGQLDEAPTLDEDGFYYIFNLASGKPIFLTNNFAIYLMAFLLSTRFSDITEDNCT
jgi:hypothetical protein